MEYILHVCLYYRKINKKQQQPTKMNRYLLMNREKAWDAEIQKLRLTEKIEKVKYNETEKTKTPNNMTS